jgi:expansin (peptidoglycan-binding protein)
MPDLAVKFTVYVHILQSALPSSLTVSPKDSEFLIAMSPEHGHNAHCGRMVTIKNVGGGINNQGTGKTITAIVADTCPSDECNLGHLDLSTGAFTTLTGGPLDPPGKISIQWHVLCTGCENIDANFRQVVQLSSSLGFGRVLGSGIDKMCEYF